MRAWIRYCLNKRILSSMLSFLCRNIDRDSDIDSDRDRDIHRPRHNLFYQEIFDVYFFKHSFFRSEDSMIEILGYIGLLENSHLEFDFEINDVELNASLMDDNDNTKTIRARSLYT